MAFNRAPQRKPITGRFNTVLNEYIGGLEKPMFCHVISPVNTAEYGNGSASIVRQT